MDRRTPEGYKLRVYVDAIQDAKLTSDEEWLTRWVANVNRDSMWISRLTWIAYLEQCALREAKKMMAIEESDDYKEAA